MAGTVIGPELCPACGRVTWLVRLHSGPVYCHTPRTYGDVTCLGTEYTRPGEAETVRRIREQGGERLRLAAHP
jgi:hypothetical protein